MSTKTLIQTISVGVGGAASIDFTSIPATFDDLVLEVSGRGSQASSSSEARLKINGAVTNYTNRTLYGSGASAVSSSYPLNALAYLYIGETPASSATASVFGNLEIYIPNYAGANYKSLATDNAQENNAATAYAFLVASLWSDTTAINQITLVLGSGSFAQYSIASLYGIKNS